MQIEDLYKVYLESTGVSIDTRTIKERQLFFAIKGERFDGHKFIDKAIEAGAHKVVIDDATYSQEYTILVPDVITALQDLARHHRRQFSGPVLAITGSNGKTTTKELIAAVCSRKYNVLATSGNLNNHLGVPLTLLSRNAQHNFLIIEMGANKPGDIEELCLIAEPNYGLITNIGMAHIEGFGSLEGVKQTKSELYRYVQSRDGLLFADQDDNVLLSLLPENSNVQHYEVEDLEFMYGKNMLEFEDLETEEVYSTKLYGRYNQQNIEAAVTVGRYFKVLDEEIFESIERYTPKMNRSQIEHIGKHTVIMDAYNANPSSMKASIKSLMNAGGGKKTLILGDMKELGEEEIKMHQEIIDYLRGYDWTHVLLVGPLFSSTDNAEGYDVYKDANEVIRSGLDRLLSYDSQTILLKGSRSMKLESLMEHFNPSD